jgi:hypothetical protein
VTIAAAIWSSPGSSGHETGGGPLIPPGSMAPRGARENLVDPDPPQPRLQVALAPCLGGDSLKIAPTVRQAIRISAATAVWSS